MTYRASKGRFYTLYPCWVVERQIPCINGLSAWFGIALIDEPSEEEMGYTNRAIGSAEDRAKLIADAMNRK